MVDSNKINYGVDKIGQVIHLAGCNRAGGAVLIDRLIQIDVSDIKSEIINDYDRLQFSVTEDNAIIKRIKVPKGKNIDGNELAEFEFVSTLLDKKEDLYIKTNSVNGGSEYLVCGCHRNIINDQNRYFEDKLRRPSGYKLRALAMADGYANFCWREGGEFICLLDLSPSIVSYCFINNGRPIFIGSIDGESTKDSDNKKMSELFLSDLKATIQFQTDNLFKAGYSAPLSLVVVSGLLAGKESNEIIEKKLGLRTISPTFKTALFDPELVDRAGHYLVSLGLTVDN